MKPVTRFSGSARRVAPTMLITLASQGVSSVGLLLLPLLGPHVSDAYALGVQTGSAALTSVAFGVVYNVTIGRPGYSRWRMWGWIAACSSIAFGAATILLEQVSGTGRPERAIAIGMFAVGGAALAASGVAAVRFACNGRPLYLAGINLVPNAVLTLAIVVSIFIGPSAGISPLLPALAWMMATVAELIILGRRSVSSATTLGKGDPPGSEAIHVMALAIGAITSGILPSVYLVAIGRLQEGTLTALFIITKIGAALIGVGVNSVLLSVYSWYTKPEWLASTVRRLVFVSLLLLIAGAVARPVAPPAASHAVVGLGWVTALAAGALVLREINSRGLSTILLMKSVFDLAASAVAAAVLMSTPSVTGYLGVYVLSQGVTTAFCLRALRDRPGSIGGIALAVAGSATIIWGW